MPAAVAASWSWPVRGDVVTRYANGDDPYAGGQHRGIDIAAGVGAPVSAAAAGRVTFAGVAGSSGLTVTVRSADGSWDASYLHLSAAAVLEGAVVGRGDRIGAVGVSGRRSVSQPHLHFGIREAGNRHAYRDPLDLLPPIVPPTPEPTAPADAPAGAPAPVPPSVSPAAAPGPSAASEPLPDVLATPSTAPASGGALAGTPAPAGVLGSGSRDARPGFAFESGSRSAGGLGFERSGSRGRSAVAAAVTSAAGGTTTHDKGGRSSRAAAHGSRETAPTVPPTRPVRSAVAAGGSAEPATAPRGGASPAAARPTPGSDDGVDIGWLAALVGCLAAALCLGRPESTVRAARRGSAWLGPRAGRLSNFGER